MIRYNFRKEKSSLGEILRPIADVVLESKGFKIEVPMYIDSGADISMIPLNLGKSLGFKQEKSDIIREIKGVSGAGIPYIVKKVGLILNGERLMIRIAWALVEQVPILMGRTDIFNKFRIVFNERKKYIDFEKLDL